jgi:hypothetical protein
MASAISQALQSLGLTPPAGGTTAAGSTSSSSADSTEATATSGAGKVKDDLRQFMHQLFEAVKAEGAASPQARRQHHRREIRKPASLPGCRP